LVVVQDVTKLTHQKLSNMKSLVKIGREVSRRRLGETENTFARKLRESNKKQRKCRQCGLPENNHRAYHLFDNGNGQFNPYSNSLN